MKINKIEARAFKIPTDRPESDGTLEWDSTTLVVAWVHAGAMRGIGYSYTHAAAVRLITDTLSGMIVGKDCFDLPACWNAMVGSIRNLGTSAVCMMAVSAVDAALWDLKAKCMKIPLAALLGRARKKLPVYGSGGFTSYTLDELKGQLAYWAAEGIPRVKMKIGRDPDDDPYRVKAAREAIGENAELFVDANGAYSRKQALYMAELMADMDVSWFEEPVHHLDTKGLNFIRDRSPSGMDVSAGEYGFYVTDFIRLLSGGAVDVLQADATRCGITGFIQAAGLCEGFMVPLSSHCAPSLHLHVCAAMEPVRHMEYFHDHVRIEKMLFEGFVDQEGGTLSPDMSRPGIGLELKEKDAVKFEI